MRKPNADRHISDHSVFDEIEEHEKWRDDMMRDAFGDTVSEALQKDTPEEMPEDLIQLLNQDSKHALQEAFKRQAEREARLNRQVDNSDEQLRILKTQVEEGKRSQAEQEWSNRKALWLAAAALFVSLLTGFWEAEELRAMIVDFFDELSE